MVGHIDFILGVAAQYSATTLPLEVFTQRNFVAEFVRFKLIFINKK